jgi:hypothetical protein
VTTFGFRLLFWTLAGRTFSGVTIDSDTPVALPGVVEQVSLRQLPRRSNHSPGAPERLVIRGTGFADHDAAYTCGQRLKQALQVVGCDTGYGMNVGRDVASTRVASAVKDMLRSQLGIEHRDNVHGLDAFPEDLPVVRGEVSMRLTTTFPPLADFPEKLAIEFADFRPLTSRLGLALELYNLGLFEPDTKARFLNLITVVEILSEREEMPKPIRSVVQDCIGVVQASSLPSSDVNGVTRRLDDLKRESVGAACRRVVARVLGKDAAEYFGKCYVARSELLHAGKTARPEARDVTLLDKVVRDLLLASVRGLPASP